MPSPPILKKRVSGELCTSSMSPCLGISKDQSDCRMYEHTLQKCNKFNVALQEQSASKLIKPMRLTIER